jgi:DNA-binding SARP family transcriptional activator
VQAGSLNTSQFQRLAKAAELYSSGLLDGWYQDWCLLERERLHDAHLCVLDKLAGYCEITEQYELGMVYAGRILKQDRARESTHRQLMRLHYLAGDRSSALRQYERCAAALREELDVKVDQSTRILSERIRAGEPIAASTRASRQGPPIDTGVLPELLGSLNNWSTVLTDLHRQVQEGIKAIESILTRGR